MLPPIRFLSLALVALTAALARKPEDIADYPPLERVGFDQTANEVQAGGKLPQVPWPAEADHRQRRRDRRGRGCSS